MDRAVLLKSIVHSDRFDVTRFCTRGGRIGVLYVPARAPGLPSVWSTAVVSSRRAFRQRANKAFARFKAIVVGPGDGL